MITTNSSKGLAGLLLALLLVITSLSHGFDLLRHADYWLSDHLIKRMAKDLPPDPDIVVIDIDDASLNQMTDYAGRWVWPRSVHAELLEGLAKYQPAAVVFDILFSEADIYRPDADSYFNEVLAEQDNVYFGMLVLNAFDTSRGGKQLAELAPQLGLVARGHADPNARAHLLLPEAIDSTNWRLGSINYLAESDGVGRRYDVWRELSGWRLPSLATKVVTGLSIEPPELETIQLQWRGDEYLSYRQYSYVDIYRAILSDDQALLSQLSDKIIIIGSTAAGLFDVRVTPISNQYPAVFILATAIDNLKNNRHLTQLADHLPWLVSCILILLLALLFAYIKRFNRQMLVAAAFCLSAGALLVVVSYSLLADRLILYTASSVISLLLAYVAFSLSYGYREYLQRQKALNLFGRFLDPNVVEGLVSQGRLDLENTSQQVKLTVLFSDIRGFTTISEKHSAEQIVNLLNNYFDRQVRTIFDHHGTLDKFIGDCIMAFWGAPVASENQQVDAINTALTMAEQLTDFQRDLPESMQGFDVGIGIHTGDAVVGMIGSEQRVDYTAIGDTVNLASRIEGVTKNICRILVSESTKQGCEHLFDFEYRGEFEVKGRQQAVKLYQPKRKSK